VAAPGRLADELHAHPAGVQAAPRECLAALRTTHAPPMLSVHLYACIAHRDACLQRSCAAAAGSCRQSIEVGPACEARPTRRPGSLFSPALLRVSAQLSRAGPGRRCGGAPCRPPLAPGLSLRTFRLRTWLLSRRLKRLRKSPMCRQRRSRQRRSRCLSPRRCVRRFSVPCRPSGCASRADAPAAAERRQRDVRAAVGHALRGARAGRAAAVRTGRPRRSASATGGPHRHRRRAGGSAGRLRAGVGSAG
jgi:hypothetical protein